MPPENTTEAFDFEDLVGEEFDFYGVDNNCFKLDDRAYEAIEDAEDGYRSLETVEICKDQARLIFFVMPVARVVLEYVEEDDDSKYYKLIDLHDGHCWLRIGTDHSDWYPDFIFEYTPKGPRD